MTID
jgi:hypothetical protein